MALFLPTYSYTLKDRIADDQNKVRQINYILDRLYKYEIILTNQLEPDVVFDDQTVRGFLANVVWEKIHRNGRSDHFTSMNGLMRDNLTELITDGEYSLIMFAR